MSCNYSNIFQGNKVQILSELYLESVYRDVHFVKTLTRIPPLNSFFFILLLKQANDTYQDFNKRVNFNQDNLYLSLHFYSFFLREHNQFFSLVLKKNIILHNLLHVIHHCSLNINSLYRI